MKTMEHLIKKLEPLARFASIAGLLVFACLQTGRAQDCFDVTFSADKLEVCKGDAITFSIDIEDIDPFSCTNYKIELYKSFLLDSILIDTISNSTGNSTYTYDTNDDLSDFFVFAKIIGNNCGGTCNDTLITQQPIIINLLNISAEITPDPAVISCGNNDVTLTASNTADPAGTYTYTWGAPGGSTFMGEALTVSAAGTYTVTISGGTACSDTKSVTVTKTTQINVNITTNPSDGSFCEGDSITLTATAGTNYSYEWSTDDTQQSITVGEPGTYSVTVTRGNCTGTANSEVNMLAKPGLGDHADTYYVKSGESQKIMFTPPSGIKVNWQLLDSSNVTSLAATSGTGSFTRTFSSRDLRAPGQVRYIAEAKYISNSNCTGEIDTIVVLVIPVDTTDAPFIPEVVTPNNDGSNDFWNVLFPNDDADNYKVVVYNRSGGKVYEKDTMIENWSPVGCPDGVYYYLITAKDGGRQYKGALTIIGGNE